MKGFFASHGTPRQWLLLGVGLLLALAAALPATTALAAPSACDLTCLQQRGDELISKRLASLNEATSKINDQVTKQHLTSTQAGPLLGQITDDVNGLTALKSKLDADTDPQTARKDVLSIFLTYRIYAVFLPRTRHVVLLDIMTNVDAKLKGLEPKIEDAISKAPDNEKGQLNQLYSDFKAQLKEAEAQIDAAQGQLPVLTPNTYNTDRTAYTNAWNAFKSDTQAAHTALKNARSDLHQIATILKSNSSSAAPTATTGS